ncbi:MAG: UvrB/UvrC motif-containing protein [Chlamydiia bacterium]|nr:UvrB/UvrC motif-containing protein [Chlamydiia bacterium]MCP5509573.1 UvrB/UvrC motif-containing protein [Chlamydiales bacterium]HPE85595.1 UvrB/UvrC motif-containing protein [Chlamydiales bacterium]
MTKRPMECSRCRKKASILYQEIECDVTIYTQMCSDCPVLKARLGTPGPSESTTGSMCCVRCHTSLDQIKESQTLGCCNCYTVFQDYITEQALRCGLTPPFHKGKCPGSNQKFSIPERITDLTGALNQALNKENYEEAAVLRDQIQELMSEPDGT